MRQPPMWVGIVASLALALFTGVASAAPAPVLLKDGVTVYTSAKPGEPLYRAVAVLQRDLQKVVGSAPAIRPLTDDIRTPGIVVRAAPELGAEAHRVRVGEVNGTPQVLLEGGDVRGEIYAIYTFSEQVLGVPPFWYYSGWRPGGPREVSVSANLDIAVPSPQVKYRAWFPNDTDLFEPWRKLSATNNEMWLEAALRLKLNAIEWFDGDRDYSGAYDVSPTTQLISDYGLINTTHHHSPLNASLEGWEKYWKQVRRTTPPELSLANERALEEFWRYNVECVVRHHIDMLWTIGFRGRGDHPFWYTFKDAPASMAERGKVVGRMMQKQRDLVVAVSGDRDARFRTIFYDELSDLLSAGFLHPPEDPALIWTYVAARRDHYPNTDIQQLPAGSDRTLGYYFNCQFTSTGSHLAAAEGPWKIEQNLRYVAGKSARPLAFSVVNAGNIREYVMELSAHAAMMWDPAAYTSDRFVRTFCATYYGSEQADRIAQLYKDYYRAYWNQRRSALVDRQYIFQDLRYKSAIAAICGAFGKPFDPNPLRDLRAEQEPGRTYRIVPADNGAATQVEAIVTGTTASAEAFARVARDADAAYATLGEDRKPFFNDNLRQPAHFMRELNVCLLELTQAYAATDVPARSAAVDRAQRALQSAEQALKQTQHGPFAKWYAGDHVFGFRALREQLAKLTRKT